ncbi:Herpes-BLLF1 multi-domain protein [Pyrenophora tritici-repentis]|nr:Herpes-BLLF1 multi-domain protein [Pyrenophora tritici-repentis]KAI0605337.1 Herpes-BLLF1 multi-domain protein [Pyrenophora tritici-repentis]
MQTRRKQPFRAAPFEAWPSGVPLRRIVTNPRPSSKATASAAPKAKRSADEYAEDASPAISFPRPAKKMKTSVKPAPKATSARATPAPRATPARKSKQSTAAPSTAPIAAPPKKSSAIKTHTAPVALPPKKSSAIKAYSKRATKLSIPTTTLVPHVPRQRAILGQKDESLLRITGKSAITHKTNDLRFRLIPHASIDWNNAYHIGKINSWRNQIYQRAGIKTRLIVSWHELEELWMELYYQLSIVEARQRNGNIILPSPKQLRDSFNELFVGRVLKDRRGRSLAPRDERHATAFGSKFNRMFHTLKARLNACVRGKGKEFMPEIRFAMLLAYKAKKVEMGVEADDAVDGEEWEAFLEQLYEIADEEEQHLTEEQAEEMKEDGDLEDEQDLMQEEEDDLDYGDSGAEEEKQDLMQEEDESDSETVAGYEDRHPTQQQQEAFGLTALEADAIDALLSLSSASNNHTTAYGFATPELTRSARTSLSTAESVPTPPSQGATYIAGGYDVDNRDKDAAGERVVGGCKNCDIFAANVLLSARRG